MLQNKKILLGISGSIAAYKSAVLARLLVKSGAEVKVVMTPEATKFITPLTLATLTKNSVLHTFTKNENGEWNNHVDLGLWADLMVIAPASANTISKMANGICDNLLLAVYLSSRCPLMVAPAMDLDMYAHPSTQQNILKLKEYGNIVLNAEFGELASGLNGNGRMAEPEEILNEIELLLNPKTALYGKKVLVTAGPTVEPIDPVRFISNHSSGKMGYAIADVFAKQGCEVILVSGPTNCLAQHKNIKVINILTAIEMFNACMEHFKNTDIAIMSAAVADYTPAKKSNEKIKKNEENLTIELTKNPDILNTLGKNKRSNQIVVGFALETNNEMENAIKKLKEKNADLIVLNSLNDEGAGFGSNTNKISILHKNGEVKNFELKPKELVATDILNEIALLLNE
ncbi:MAG: bifunctional phosphopantothenoylcysteine decarboxylase/phosphopantothenate--cysteine ligase CoaBC [Bacteroidia bacterium]